MRAIDPTLVDEVWREMMAYPAGRVEAEAQAFLARQPYVAAFARAMIEEQDPVVQKAALGLCFLLFKILERSLGRPFPLVSAERIAEAYDATAAWLEHSPAASPASVLSATSDPGHPTLVDEVWREMMSYPAGRVEAEAQAFLAGQPHVAAFARAMIKDQDPVVQKAAFGLCFLLFKILERSLGRPFPLVSAERIADAYDATTAWLEHSPGASPASVLGASSDPGHPTLVAHILSVFYGDDHRPADCDEGVRASLLLLLRTLSDALDVGPVEA